MKSYSSFTKIEKILTVVLKKLRKDDNYDENDNIFII